MDTILLNALVLFGTVCVLATFGFMMPLVGQTLSMLFTAVMAEKAVAHVRGERSGTELDLD